MTVPRTIAVAPTTTTAAPTTTTNAPAAPAAQYLFDDEFSGATNTAPEPSKWVVKSSCQGFTDTNSCPATPNVFQDGAGNLALQIKRVGSGYSGALVATYNYGMDWPNVASNVKAAFAPPYEISMRALMPNTPGAWPALWGYNVDRTAAQHNYEVDFAEGRMTFPTTAGCHQHDWVNGHDMGAWNGGIGVTNMSTNWHTYSARVFIDHVTYYVDGAVCGTGPGVSGAQGAILDNVLGQPGSWGSGGGAPAAGDPGPWNMLVDYLRVTRI